MQIFNLCRILCLLVVCVKNLDAFSVKLINAVLLAQTRIMCSYSFRNVIIIGGPMTANTRDL